MNIMREAKRQENSKRRKSDLARVWDRSYVRLDLNSF